MSARVRFSFYLIDNLGDLIDVPPIRSRPASPLRAIYRTQFPVFVRPFVPDRDLIVVEILNVGISIQEPQQLIYYRAKVKLFRGDKRKSLRQVKPQLSSKYA